MQKFSEQFKCKNFQSSRLRSEYFSWARANNSITLRQSNPLDGDYHLHSLKQRYLKFKMTISSLWNLNQKDEAMYTYYLKWGFFTLKEYLLPHTVLEDEANLKDFAALEKIKHSKLLLIAFALWYFDWILTTAHRSSNAIATTWNISLSQLWMVHITQCVKTELPCLEA